MTSGSLTKTYPVVDLHGAFLRRTNLSNARLWNANLSGADFSHANFRRSDFRDARLNGTILRGADLTDAKNLTVEQLAGAIIDEDTRLPVYIDRKKLLGEARSTQTGEGARS